MLENIKCLFEHFQFLPGLFICAILPVHQRDSMKTAWYKKTLFPPKLFDDFTNQLINLLNHLEIDKIHLVGFSIGSLIARNFATQYCDNLKSLTLFGSIFNRSNEQQKLVNDRFENMKKEKKIPHSSLTRWLSDDF